MKFVACRFGRAGCVGHASRAGFLFFSAVFASSLDASNFSSISTAFILLDSYGAALSFSIEVIFLPFNKSAQFIK